MIYFYYGENLYSLEEKLALFKKRYLAKFPSGLGFSKIDFSEDEADDFKNVVKTHSMFEEKKLIFLTEVFNLKKEAIDELIQLIKDEKVIDSEEVVILFYERIAKEELNKKSRKLFTFLTTKAKSEEFKKLSPAGLIKWVETLARKKEGKISPSAVSSLIERVGSDYIRLAQELEKLLLFKNPHTVEQTDVELLVNPEIETNIFKTIEALAKKDLTGALENLRRHQANGDRPETILATFAYQLRVLLLLKETDATGREELAQTFKLHPYVIKKNLAFTRNFTLAELTNMYHRLAEADIALKTGRKAPQEALEDFILSIG